MIDIAKLFQASEGDPEAKVSVKKKWLREVWTLLQDRERLAKENRRLEAENFKLRHQTSTRIMAKDDPEWQEFEQNMATIDRGLGTIDKGMEGIFGRGGTFDKFFGRKTK